MSKLSAKFVENISVKGRYQDGGGLILFVNHTPKRVTKSWVVRYTSPTRKYRRDMGLGSLEEIGLAKARLKAAKAMYAVSQGDDPLDTNSEFGARVTRRANRSFSNSSLDFESVVREFHARHKVTLKNEKYAAQWFRNLERLLFTHIGKNQFNQLTASDLLAVIQPIAIRTPEQARRIIIQLVMIFSDAVARGLVSENPADKLKILVKYPSIEKLNHPSLSWRNAPRFISELLGSKLPKIVKLAYLFLILTAARSTEVLQATWNEFDLENQHWTIPVERMKAGRVHQVSLPDTAMQVLEQICPKHDANPSGYVFEGERKASSINSNSLLNATKILGYRGLVTPHGFRSTFSTWAYENSIASPETIEMALAHVSGDQVSRAYNKADYLGQRRELLERWANYLLSECSHFADYQKSNS
jgi:integrase